MKKIMKAILTFFKNEKKAILISTITTALIMLAGTITINSTQGLKGEQGIQGEQGLPGEDGVNGIDGVTPTIDISEDGYWIINGTKTEYKAIGVDGTNGANGTNGVGIASTEMDENGNIVITYTDGKVEIVEMPKKAEHAHEFEDWVNFTDDNTLCDQRLYFRVCSTCKGLEWKQGSYEDHDWDIVTTEPTCQAQGFDTKTCTICGKVEICNETSVTDHDYKTEYTTDNSFHWLDCKNCTAVNARAEHNIGEDGYCTICNAPLAPTEGVMYDLSSDGTYALVVGYTGNAKRVIIADVYMDKPVREIAQSAFRNTGITDVVIPASVTSIGYSAFSSADVYTSTNLRTVTFAEGSKLTSIGNMAFRNCTLLTSINIPASVISIDTCAFSGNMSLNNVTFAEGSQLTYIGNYAFECCTSLTSIEIPSGVTYIGNGAFDSDEHSPMRLVNVFFNEDSELTYIGEYAFDHCPRLTSIYIPTNVTYIGTRAFAACTSLTSITFGENCAVQLGAKVFHECDKLAKTQFGNCTYIKANDNPYFILYSCDIKNFTTYEVHEDTKIIAGEAFGYCKRLSTIEIPSNVTGIGDGAFKYCTSLTMIEIPANVTAIGYMTFYHCTSLTSIKMPDSATTIGDSAFEGCTSLTNVTIGDSVTSIGNYAFYGCTSLTSINYEGTVEQWNNIVFGDFWKYQVPATKVICSDGTVTL